MPSIPHVGSSNNPVVGSRDNHPKPSIFGRSPSRKSSRKTVPSQDGDSAAHHGGPVQSIASGAADGNRRAISSSALRAGTIPPPATVGAARLRKNAWTPGFEKAMNDLANGGRPSIPGFVGPSHLAPGAINTGRFVNAAHQGAPTLTSKDYSARLDLGPIREGIENAVEQQVADALGPIRLVTNTLVDNVHALGSIRQAIDQESGDLHEQNNVLSRQIDLHYRDIRQHSETSSAQIRALAGLMEAHGHAGLSTNAHVRALANLAETHTQINQAATENINRTTILLNQLSQVITSLPGYVGHVVNRAVALEYQGSSALIIAAQRQAFDNIFGFYNQHQAEFESREAILETREEQLESREAKLVCREAELKSREDNVESHRHANMKQSNNMEFANPDVGVGNAFAAHQERRGSNAAEDKSIKRAEDSETARESSATQGDTVVDTDIKQQEGTEVIREEKPARKVGGKTNSSSKRLARSVAKSRAWLIKAGSKLAQSQ